ncbi:MAG: histidine kinase [Treponema sp.]|nr:histidine kinase [Treponema sp.]
MSYFAILALFIYYLTDFISRKTPVSWTFAHISLAICFLYTIGWCASVFTGMFFQIENGKFTRSPNFWFAQFCGYFILGMTIFLIIKYFRILKKLEIAVFIAFAILPISSSFLRQKFPYFSNQIALSFSIQFIYHFIQLTQIRTTIQQESLIRENRLSLSFSQIRPHFIFNTLNSIYVLCDKDPAIAKKAIGDLSSYLRTNLEVLSSQRIVPFKKEIEHLEYYINLEKLRFRDDLFITYDFQETNFQLPQLTLQPIVENAIKHGILKKKCGGSVSISSCKTDKYYKIKVSDDGIGFDTSILSYPESKDGQIHVGLKNVQDRLWILCHGNLIIKSEPGKGTVVIIEIPIYNNEELK